MDVDLLFVELDLGVVVLLGDVVLLLLLGISLNDGQFPLLEFLLHVEQRAEPLILNDLFQDELLVAVLHLDATLLRSAIRLQTAGLIRLDFHVVRILSQADELVDQTTSEPVLDHNLVDDVLDEAFAVLGVGVALDDFGDEGAGLDSDVHHVQEEVEVGQQVLLAVRVLVGQVEQEVDHLLEQVFVVELFEDQSPQQAVHEVVDDVDVPQHVLQLAVLHGVRFVEGVDDGLQDVDDVVLGVLGFHAGALLVDHVEHLVLDQFVDQLLHLPLSLQEVEVNLVVFTTHNDIRSGQLLHKQVALVEVSDQHLKSLDPYFEGAIVAEDVGRQVEVKGNLLVHQGVLAIFEVVVHGVFLLGLEQVLVDLFTAFSQLLLHEFVGHFELSVELVEVEEVLELHLQIEDLLTADVRV
mmetsp:Transcript_30174/g.46107  ORF Transcript_30174/g.46107 Transcript_30174/m.46107 type:complete len:409 (+) Transcript_30174:5113-6339(+)